MATRCDYIGCFQTVQTDSDTYCPNHARIGSMLKPLSHSEYPKVMDTMGTSEQDSSLYSKMLVLLEEYKQIRPMPLDRKENIDFYTRMDELRTEILNEEAKVRQSTSVGTPSVQCLRQKLHQRIRQKHTETRTNKNSKVNQKTLKKVKRIIREKGGEKITEEHEETEDQSERMETLVQFKTEQELDVYVEETTERYDSKMVEYAQNKELVFSSLSKWFEEIANERTKDRLDTSLPIQKLMNTPRLDLFQKQTIIYWQMWSNLWQTDTEVPPLPVLQQIIYYTIETLPDGPRKMFHCKFSHNKLAPESIVVSVPEIFLRAFPCYSDVIHAFFISKFIPFRKLFMKHRRQQELNLQSADQQLADATLDNIMDEEDQCGFKDDQITEINPKVCYHRSG